MKIESDQQIVVNKNGLSLWVFPKEFSTSDGIANVGKKGYVRMVREYRRLVPDSVSTPSILMVTAD